LRSRCRRQLEAQLATDVVDGDADEELFVAQDAHSLFAFATKKGGGDPAKQKKKKKGKVRKTVVHA
jgi:hypothetical protein